MANISGILCQIITGDVDDAGTDGRIYLGLGGREFRLDSKEDDYERGSWREYVLGEGPVEPNLPPPQIRVENPQFNDPRTGFPLKTENLDKTPIYLRFEPEGDSPNWNLKFAVVLVYAGSFFAAFTAPQEFDNLWLGDSMGKALFLTEFYRGDDQRVLSRGRGVVEEMKTKGA